MTKTHPYDTRHRRKCCTQTIEHHVAFKKQEEEEYDLLVAALVLSEMPFPRKTVSFDENSFSENHLTCVGCGYETNNKRRMAHHFCLS